MKRYMDNIIRVTQENRESSRERSSAIFGNRYFVDVVLAVDQLSSANSAPVTMRMVASETTLSDSLVRQVMQRLRDADLIAEPPRTGGTRSPRYFEVRRGPLWNGVLSACTATQHEAESPQSS